MNLRGTNYKHRVSNDGSLDSNHVIFWMHENKLFKGFFEGFFEGFFKGFLRDFWELFEVFLEGFFEGLSEDLFERIESDDNLYSSILLQKTSWLGYQMTASDVGL